MRTVPFWLVATMSFLLGCSGAGGDGDAGPDADARDTGADAGADGSGDPAGDRDPEDHYALVVPPDTALCGVFREDRTIMEEFSLLCRITLVPGEHLLPTDQRSFGLTLVETVELGPARQVGTFQGAGTCQHEPQDAWHAYDCDQTFDVQGTPLRINYRVTFPHQDADRIVFDTSYTYYPMMEGFVGPGEDYHSEQIQFAACRISELNTYRMTLHWENGDTTVFDQPTWNRPVYFPGYVGETSPANLERALVTLDGHQREITGYFDLVYAAQHHNWFEEYLVILLPPEGEVHGLYCIDAGDMGMAAPEQLLYLGPDLDIHNPVATTPLADYQVEQLP